MSYEEKYCQWVHKIDFHFDSCFETECGNAHAFPEGNVQDNSYKFCPFCGREICQLYTSPLD